MCCEPALYINQRPVDRIVLLSVAARHCSVGLILRSFPDLPPGFVTGPSGRCPSSRPSVELRRVSLSQILNPPLSYEAGVENLPGLLYLASVGRRRIQLTRGTRRRRRRRWCCLMDNGDELVGGLSVVARGRHPRELFAPRCNTNESDDGEKQPVMQKTGYEIFNV